MIEKAKKMVNDKEVISELYLDEPCKELQEWAKKNIREDPDTRCQFLEDLRDLIYSRGECTPFRIDDAFLLRFIRGRNYSLEAAYHLYVNYCNFREDNSELFEGPWLSVLNRVGEDDLIVVPPFREQLGRRMMIYKFGKWNPQTFDIKDIFRATMILLELSILEPSGQILGGVCIVDLANLSLQQTWHMTPSMAHKVIQIMVTSFPMKVHALHIVNQPKIFDIVFALFKPLLNDRMRERVFFHGDDMSSLHKHVDPKSLPQEYGGVHPAYDYRDWLEGFKKNKTILQEMETLGYTFDENQNEIDDN